MSTLHPQLSRVADSGDSITSPPPPWRLDRLVPHPTRQDIAILVCAGVYGYAAAVERHEHGASLVPGARIWTSSHGTAQAAWDEALALTPVIDAMLVAGAAALARIGGGQ